MERGAVIDPTGQYRYSLWRSWDAAAPRLGFVMLNPSTADGQQDDPTIRRCMGFARAWGYGAVEVVNLFAYRATTPQQLRQAEEPIGNANDRYLTAASESVATLVLAWGNWGNWQGRDRAVTQLVAHHPNLCCFGWTQTGQPRHPLYLRREASLFSFTKESSARSIGS